MKAADAMLLALREYAAPSCRRCHGRGATGEDIVATLCACVRRRVSVEDVTPGGDDGEEAVPHPWGAITRRAQQIHAAAMLQAVPDTWS
ncbi:MAG: hypothetical protein HY873_06600 [Chloroflexi bacterium]|nr:hypothetical protein [Chloroflexota bacterium]